ncbi:hypothetical protein EPUL_005913, partial [Erysiphe pulchra]
MVHGPCGVNHPNSPCFRDGKCSKAYTKRWCEATILGENSYPEYARPNNGVTWEKNGFVFDNRWVVPYNPYLTKKYNAHINVENQYDEITMTVQGRYISSVQAVWRLMAYTTHEEKPAIMLLPFHLEGRHRVNFSVRLTDEQLAAAIRSQSSVFLDWMADNEQHADGRDLLYTDFPYFYTHTKNRGWHPRRKGQTIGRIPVAVPTQGEHFYLRQLLTVKARARSYRDLYTINGTTCDCPSAACRALGLTFDDSDWYNQEEERIQHSESISMFSSGQQQAYCTIINTVDTNIRPNTFFLQDPAGTGKTFLYKILCNYYRSQGGIVLCVASSGIASLLLPGGSTAHSLFRIPIECTDSSRCHISRQTKLARLLTVTKLILWDEVTMQNKHNFNAVDKTLRDLMNSDELFGGIPVVLGGDFAQILPVVKRGQRQD